MFFFGSSIQSILVHPNQSLLYFLPPPPLSSVQGLDLPINTFSCTVGLKLSQANYYIKSSLAAAALCKEARS